MLTNSSRSTIPMTNPRANILYKTTNRSKKFDSTRHWTVSQIRNSPIPKIIFLFSQSSPFIHDPSNATEFCNHTQLRIVDVSNRWTSTLSVGCRSSKFAEGCWSREDRDCHGHTWNFAHPEWKKRYGQSKESGPSVTFGCFIQWRPIILFVFLLLSFPSFLADFMQQRHHVARERRSSAMPLRNGGQKESRPLPRHGSSYFSTLSTFPKRRDDTRTVAPHCSHWTPLS